MLEILAKKMLALLVVLLVLGLWVYVWQVLPYQNPVPLSEVKEEVIKKEGNLKDAINAYMQEVNFDEVRIKYFIAKATQERIVIPKIRDFALLCEYVSKADTVLKANKADKATIDRLVIAFNGYLSSENNLLNEEQKSEIKLYIDILQRLRQYGSLEKVKNNFSIPKKQEVSKFLERRGIMR